MRKRAGGRFSPVMPITLCALGLLACSDTRNYHETVECSENVDCRGPSSPVPNNAAAFGTNGTSEDAGVVCPNGATANYVPYIAAGFVNVFQPACTTSACTDYLNDHTLIKDPFGVWHLYGITNPSTGEPSEEVTFLHATSPTLFGPWTQVAPVLTADTALDETNLWHPYAFEVSAGNWSMFYFAGSSENPQPANMLRRADTTDPHLTNWVRAEANGIDPTDRPPGGRDPMVLHLTEADGDHWLLYSVGVDEASCSSSTGLCNGEILMTETTDIHGSSWSPAVPVITDPVPNFDWGNLETPSVIPYGGQYYLFLTRTAPNNTAYNDTEVFRSADPRNFGSWAPITTIWSHAPEVVNESGNYYITSCGWTSEVGQADRGLMMAPLNWAFVGCQ